nr:synaptotagmin-7-like isoform X2 [Biomphalaria glabrata]
MSVSAILVGSLLGILICVLVGAVVYTVCKRRKMFADDEEKVSPPKVYQVNGLKDSSGNMLLHNGFEDNVSGGSTSSLTKNGDNSIMGKRAVKQQLDSK